MLNLSVDIIKKLSMVSKSINSIDGIE